MLWIPSSLGMLNSLFACARICPLRQVQDLVDVVLKEQLPTLKVSEVVALEDCAGIAFRPSATFWVWWASSGAPL